MLIRKIGKAALGKATPMQTVLATTLAGMLGFVPGVFLLGVSGAFTQSPGLLLSLVFLALILNANLAVFGVTLIAAKLLGLVLLPVSFWIGRILLDGPTAPLFEVLVNAPVLAWFGLEYYATSGALLLGSLFGIGTGVFLVRAQRRLREKLATLEEGSERYQKWASKKSVRFLAWLLIGAKQGKKSWRELADERRRGSPVRIAGLVVVAVFGVGLFLAQSFLSGPAFRTLARGSLESWNGATVDLAQAAVDLAGGKIDVAGLEMADAEALANNLFDARTLELRIGTTELLKKRLVVDEIASREAATGTERASPGERIGAPKPPPPPPPSEGDEKTLEDYLQEAEVWKERLTQIADVLERLLGPEEEAADDPEARDQRVRDQREQLGMARTAAEHLIAGAPMVLIRKVTFEGIDATQLGTQFDLHAVNLSTNPRLVDEPLEISIRSQDDRIAIGLQAGGGQQLTARLLWKDISSEAVASLLKVSPMRGGTVDLELAGTLDRSGPEGLWIDSPLQVTLRDTVLTLPGLPEAKVDQLTLPLGLRGPLAAPRISIDDEKLADALVAAGKTELANQVRSNLDAALGDRVPGIGGEAGDLIGGVKTPEQLAEEAAAKAQAEAQNKAEEELKKALPKGLIPAFPPVKK